MLQEGHKDHQGHQPPEPLPVHPAIIQKARSVQVHQSWDRETEKQLLSQGHQTPNDPEVFLSGGYSAEVKAWDAHTCKRVYRAGILQTLAILFLTGGREFVTSSDSVSQDSAERMLIAWDFQTFAKVSKQIYHELYMCPSLALYLKEDSFVAHTNDNYMALLSAQRPYRMTRGGGMRDTKVPFVCFYFSSMIGISMCLAWYGSQSEAAVNRCL
uniref:Uncharacterized protein n=1 Tax=Oncorhynchus kisutch TaxID=8019 RepID=A0A8C7DCX0_ONCKI